MSIAQRLKKLERTHGLDADQDPVEMIFVTSVAPEDPESAGYPSHAYFVGFMGEQLKAEPGESIEAFEARCKQRLEELKRGQSPQA